MTEERVKVNDPRKRLLADQAKIERRLDMLEREEGRLQPIVDAVTRTLQEYVTAEIDLQAQISYNDTEEHVEVEITLEGVRDWSDVETLLQVLEEEASYAIDDWTSSDQPKYFQRTYNWNCGYSYPFGIAIIAKLDEKDSVCRRVLVRTEHHTSDYTDEVYVFDCGEGAEAAIRRANEEQAYA